MNAAILHVPLTTPRDYTRQVIAEVAEEYGLTVAEIWQTSPTTRRATYARYHIIRRLLEQRPYWGVSDAARTFGLDHTSVLYGLRKIGYTHGRPVGSTRYRTFDQGKPNGETLFKQEGEASGDVARGEASERRQETEAA